MLTDPVDPDSLRRVLVVKLRHHGDVCRPCGNAGCGDGRISDCLTAIPVAQVLDAVHELLAAA